MPGQPADSSTENWATALRYIAGRKAAEESLGFLAHISATIRNTAGLPDIVPAVARTCIPFLGSAISLDAPAVHPEPVVRSPDGLSAALDGVRTLAGSSGEQRIVISEHEGCAQLTDPRHLELLRGWKAGSAVAVTLDYRGVSGGRLVLVRGPEHRRGPIGPGDLALIDEVADRVAAFNAFATHRGRREVRRDMAASWTDVRSWILERNPDLTDLDPDTDIIETRVISSLQFVELVLHVEQLRGTMLRSEEVTLDAFRTLKEIERKFLSQ
ncbi:hypothetical protein [Streptomyces sp. HUAS TT7]|uniref:hypothetical protein n=1 Tax=Streptomyces sp. HUAS TT7 TaxID=3447507 RepID=UPI003F65E2EF